MPLASLLISREKATPAKPAEANGSYGLALLKTVRRFIVFVLGTSVLLVGLVMIIAPGPALIVVPFGLAILATEFVWARRILEALKRRLLIASRGYGSVEVPRGARARLACWFNRCRALPGTLVRLGRGLRKARG